jgi:hypothetical protein
MEYIGVKTFLRTDVNECSPDISGAGGGRGGRDR